MASPVDLTNRELLSIGARAQVSSIFPSDGSTEANAAAVLYTPTFESLARSARWNCLRKQVVLSLLAAAQGTPENPTGTALPLPPVPWLYQYAVPSDSLACRFLVPSLPSVVGVAPQETTYSNSAATMLPGSGSIPFVVAYGTDASNNPIEILLCNQDQAQLVYTVNQPNPAVWDSQFQAAMVASLAAYFVPALSMNMQLMQAAKASADRIIMQARVADGNEGPTSMDNLPDWMRARRGEASTAWYWGSGNNNFAGYGDMCWPG